jgi:hypothetical protein
MLDKLAVDVWRDRLAGLGDIDTDGNILGLRRMRHPRQNEYPDHCGHYCFRHDNPLVF